jgi:tagatose-6-phosphate ketose/aldose isomerase
MYNEPDSITGAHRVADSLSALLVLTGQERMARGLTDTPREIQQQPETWRGTFDRLRAAHHSIAADLEACGLAGAEHDRVEVILAGAGSSDYIGRSLSRLLQQEWGCNVRSIPSTDLITSLESVILPGKRYLLISFSRSGDSSEGIALLRLALDRYPEQIRHLVITCNETGAMAKVSGVFTIVLDDAVNDRGLAMTSSFSNMVVAGQYLAHVRTPGNYEAVLQTLVSMGSSLLPRAADMAAALARKRFSRVCFLGSGALQAVAQESALKVLELNEGRIPTLAESFLGLRHGPMTFLRGDTLVCAFLSGDEDLLPWELDLLEEIHDKNLAADLLVVAPRRHPRVAALTEHVLDLQAPLLFPDGCRPPVDVIAGQLLALFLSIENGVQPDTPSRGAISRVVSHVKIHMPAGNSRS